MGIGLRTKSLLDSAIHIEKDFYEKRKADGQRNDRVDAVNIGSNLVCGFAQGFIRVPVDFYYLGYDYTDTENKVRPFGDAVSVWERDRKKFNQIFQYFFAKVNV